LKVSSFEGENSPFPVCLPGPDDQPFLEIAISGGADYLVSGNAAHSSSRLWIAEESGSR
jgi:predicted nucleic acid-binding protein